MRTLAIAALMASSVASAVPYTLHYPGTRSCAEWTANRAGKNEESLQDLGWVNGFLSGYNRYGPLKSRNVLKPSNTSGAYGFIDNYCAAHPLRPFADAVENLIDTLNSGKF